MYQKIRIEEWKATRYRCTYQYEVLNMNMKDVISDHQRSSKNCYLPCRDVRETLYNTKDSPEEIRWLSDIIFHTQSASDLSEQQATPPTRPKVRTRWGWDSSEGWGPCWQEPHSGVHRYMHTVRTNVATSHALKRLHHQQDHKTGFK